VSETTHSSRSAGRWFWRAGILCFLTSQCLALDPDKAITQFNCRTWTRQSGLPAGNVSSIIQTSDGYLWIGTAGGAVSFDGIDFKPLDLSGLQSQIVTSLSESSAGGLWMGLQHGAFASCNGKTVTYKGSEAWGGVDLNVHALLETSDQALWLAAETQLGRISMDHKFQVIISNTDCTTLTEDATGRVWIGTAHRGLYWWKNGVVKRFPSHEADTQEIRALAVCRNGDIWVGTDWGPLCYDSNFVRKDFSFPWYPTRALLVDREGTLWMGTMGNGLVKNQNGVVTTLHKLDGLADDNVGAIAEDQEGNLWVGTQQGLSQLTDFKLPTYGKSEGVTPEIVTDVTAAQNGGVWMATSHGFGCFDGHGNTTMFSLGLTNEFVNRVFEARNGDIYLIDGYQGVEVFRAGERLAQYNNTEWPSAFAEDSTSVVVAVGKDLFRVGTNFYTPFHFQGKGPELGWIFGLASGRDGSLWIATDAGVCKVKDGVARLWGPAEGMPNTHIVCVSEDDHGVVWAGGQKGIARIKDGKVVSADRNTGLFDNIIYAVVPDNQGRVWVDSSRGFFSFYTKDFDEYASSKTGHLMCIDYTGLDGVKSSERFQQKETGCRTLDGRIWFPTSQGLVGIAPDRVTPQTVPPRIYIQNARADGKELRPGQMRARPGKGNLDFQYVGLSYVAPQRIHYRYMLEGYDQEWVDAGMRRAAFYTNLKPGHYRFLVQACNEDGVWSPTAAEVAIELLPHLYQTAWFAGLMVGAFLLFLSVLYTWRLKHLTRKQQQLQKARDLLEIKVEERTRELRKEIEQRKRVQAELVDASRRAGQADVATSVLHNVGNVLNSVNTSAGVVTRLMQTIPGDGVRKVAGLLEEHRGDLTQFLAENNRATSVINYLKGIDKQLTTQQSTILSELGDLSQNIEHINQVVAMQQSFAKAAAAVEPYSLPTLVEDALRLHAGSLERNGIKVVREYDELPDINIDKHKVLQILVNLITNAGHAVREPSVQRQIVTIRVHRHGENCVRVSVTDTGVGIDPANLTRIFAHGFTTRKDGHGFGLHSGSLAAKEMGGSLRCESEGLGKGATFILELPFQPAEYASMAG
jgi:ligand-binding sensor domain-containing protein/signal transduction histidine kinase